MWFKTPYDDYILRFLVQRRFLFEIEYPKFENSVCYISIHPSCSGLFEYVWAFVTTDMKGLKNQFSWIEPNWWIMEGLNPVATYMLPPFLVNVFTEGESNGIVFNKEMHEDSCGCIILRNFLDWMAHFKRCILRCSQAVSENEVFENNKVNIS